MMMEVIITIRIFVSIKKPTKDKNVYQKRKLGQLYRPRLFGYEYNSKYPPNKERFGNDFGGFSTPNRETFFYDFCIQQYGVAFNYEEAPYGVEFTDNGPIITNI